MKSNVLVSVRNREGKSFWLVCGLALSIHSVDIPKQPGVKRETNHARERRRPNYGMITTEIGVHCGDQEPQLKHHNHQHDAQDPIDHGEPLFAAEGFLHIVLSSTPLA